MFHTSDEVFQWLNDSKPEGIKPGLERMEWFMEKLDHPEHILRTIHVGGTNGKGSTIAFLRSILQKAGYETGTYTSPAIETVKDQIRVNGVQISDEDFVKAANAIKPLVDELKTTDLGRPTEYEIVTAIAYYYFAKIHRVDLLLVEVGMGGRMDATNVIYPFISIITNVGYDHANFLGDTLLDIAKEKAGIIKNGQPVITAIRDQEILGHLETIIKEKRASLYKIDDQFSYEDFGPTHNGEFATIRTLHKTYNDVKISLLGKHQLENAAMAVMAADYLRQLYAFIIEEEHVREGLREAVWPGRFEIVQNEPAVILDGAHNTEAMENLVATVKRHYPDKKGTILFTALKDKPVAEMIKLLEQLDYPIYFTEIEGERAAKAEDLYELSQIEQKEIVKDWQPFLQKRMKQAGRDELLLVCGSFYFVSEVKRII